MRHIVINGRGRVRSMEYNCYVGRWKLCGGQYFGNIKQNMGCNLRRINLNTIMLTFKVKCTQPWESDIIEFLYIAQNIVTIRNSNQTDCNGLLIDCWSGHQTWHIVYGYPGLLTAWYFWAGGCENRIGKLKPVSNYTQRKLHYRREQRNQNNFNFPGCLSFIRTMETLK